MNRSINFILLAIFLLACSSLPSFLLATPETANCTELEFSDSDTDHLLNYGSNVFHTSDWIRDSYTVEKADAYVMYTHNSVYGVGFVDVFLLCNAAADLKNYANDENIDIILSNYDAYELITSCHKNNTFLYEFSATEESRDYSAHLWLTTLEDPNRALEVMLVLPKENPELMQDYAQKLFPELSSCK